MVEKLFSDMLESFLLRNNWILFQFHHVLSCIQFLLVIFGHLICPINIRPGLICSDNLNKRLVERNFWLCRYFKSSLVFLSSRCFHRQSVQELLEFSWSNSILLELLIHWIFLGRCVEQLAVDCRMPKKSKCRSLFDGVAPASRSLPAGVSRVNSPVGQRGVAFKRRSWRTFMKLPRESLKLGKLGKISHF